GIAELEAFFDSISVAARVRVGGLAFRVGARLKALFVAPTVHPGPMGYVSGSDLPSKIARDLTDLTPNVLVAHGPTTHDENPATTSEVHKVGETIRKALAALAYTRQAGRACRAMFKRATALAQAFGDVVLIVASFAPQPTDDIDSATGHAAVQEARLLGAREAIFVDAHNCLEPGVGLTLFGTQRSHEIIEASKAATKEALQAPKDPIRVGYGTRRGFCNPDQGIGARGIEALVIEAGGQRTAYVLFDGNNMVPGVRVAPHDDDQLDLGGPSAGAVHHLERRGRPRRARDGPVLDQIEEPPVDPQIASELRMERGPDQVLLAREDDSVLVPGLRRAVAPRPQDRGRSDEDAMEWRLEALDLEVGLERFPLAAEGIPVDGHVHQPEEFRPGLVRLEARVLCEEDATGAGAHDRHRLVGRAAD